MNKLGLLLLLLLAFQPIVPIRNSQAAAAQDAPRQIQPLVTPIPTHTPRPLVTPTPAASATRLASPPPSFAPSQTPIPSVTPNQALGHLLLGRPILDVGNGTVSRTYPYGGTNGGRLQVHHGVDLVNPIGTPIHAAGDGTVVYAGDDLTTLFAPINNYYGNLVVIQHNILSPEGFPVFTLYGHMQQVTARIGQVVREGDVIGVVGASGIALGPHLHFEVRIGSAFDFDATRNPEMWMKPYPRFGLIAGRITTAAGTLAQGVTLVIHSDLIDRRTYTYGDDSVNPDGAYGENFAIGDLPADHYTVTVIQGGQVRFNTQVTVLPDQMIWLDVPLALS